MKDVNSPTRKSKPPISAHPAFPAIVALWFAALFGFGCMVLPAAWFENAMSLSGSPLGFGGRALFAALAAIVGGLIGLMLARRIADPHANPQTANAGRDSTSAPIGPFNAQEAMKPADGDQSHEHGDGMRSAAIQEDKQESDFLVVAPLPGEETEQEVDPTTELKPQPIPVDNEETPSIDKDPAVEPADEAFDQPLVFNAPSLARRREEEPQESTTLDFEQPAGLELVGEESADEENEWADAPLEQLSLVQLVERLGHSLEKRRTLLARATVVEDPTVGAMIEATPETCAEPDALAFRRPCDAPSDATPVAPPETDEALRDALAKLQRANGAG